jgi:membrane-associated protease RseP (regulator of RpoE activity)
MKGFHMFAVLVVVSVLLVTIVLHELGHLLSARYLGISVSKFAVGLGPKLFGFRIRRGGRLGEIEWSVHALPVGGFVRIHGMFDGMRAQERAFLISEGRTEEECVALLASDRLYCHRTGWQQGLVISAGVIINLVVSVSTLIVTFWLVGAPSPPQEDHVAKVGGDSTSSVELRVVQEDAQAGKPLSLWGATVQACSMVKDASADMLVALREPVANVTSPIQVVQDTSKRVAENTMHPGFLWVMTFASINFALAFCNILPVPGLDGGHLMYAIFKGVIGVPVPVLIQTVSSAVCILLLSGLMVFALVRDAIALFR